MGEAVEAMEEAAEVKPEEIIEPVEEKKEEPTPPSTIQPPEEAPPAARIAYVQIPLTALPALQRSVLETCVEAAVKASQQGIPQSEWDGLIDATGKRFQEAISNFQPTV